MYGLVPNDDEMRQFDRGTKKEFVWDTVRHRLVRRHELCTFPLVPLALDQTIVDLACRAGSASGMKTWKNCLLVPREVRENLENGDVVIVPIDPSDRSIRTASEKIPDEISKSSKAERSTSRAPDPLVQRPRREGIAIPEFKSTGRVLALSISDVDGLSYEGEDIRR